MTENAPAPPTTPAETHEQTPTAPAEGYPVKDKEKKDEKKKKRIFSQLQNDFPELFRSDLSIHPSYTNLIIPYDVECRIRVSRTIKEYERRFKREVKSIALQQACAWDGVRVARIFINGVRIPPYVDPLTPSERRRVNALLKENLVPFS